MDFVPVVPSAMQRVPQMVVPMVDWLDKKTALWTTTHIQSQNRLNKEEGKKKKRQKERQL